MHLGILDSITADRNWKLLSALGSAVVIVCGGAWSLYKWEHREPDMGRSPAVGAVSTHSEAPMDPAVVRQQPPVAPVPTSASDLTQHSGQPSRAGNASNQRSAQERPRKPSSHPTARAPTSSVIGTYRLGYSLPVSLSHDTKVEVVSLSCFGEKCEAEIRATFTGGSNVPAWQYRTPTLVTIDGTLYYFSVIAVSDAGVTIRLAERK